MDCKSKGSPSKLRDVPFEHSHVLPCAMRELRRYSTSTTPMVLNGGPVPARSCASEERGASAQVRVHVKLKRGDTVRRRSCLLAAELLDIASGHRSRARGSRPGPSGGPAGPLDPLDPPLDPIWTLGTLRTLGTLGTLLWTPLSRDPPGPSEDGVHSNLKPPP
jgi:hypothetical protein